MFKFLKKRKQKILAKNFEIADLEQMDTVDYNTPGKVTMGGCSFEFHDAKAFYATYKEINIDQIYAFETPTKNPIIIDCGANMGLSVLYFSKAYPTAKIIAFEPEKEIFDILEKNVAEYKLNNVTLNQKAVWHEETTLKFYTDKGMGGSVTNVYKNQEPSIVNTVVLADYLQEKIDFLKMDIEGAEYEVLKNCAASLKNVSNIFVEYHSFVNQTQQLDDLLLLLKENGFRYHLKESYSRKKPFIDRGLACQNMDMAINIFAYRG